MRSFLQKTLAQPTVIAPLLLGMLFALPFALNEGLGILQQWRSSSPNGGGGIAPFFTSEVQHWHDSLVYWSETYSLDPNLLATVMQIESCGHPTVASPAGAQGLFQVMPFHFATGENMLDPSTNAMRGALFLQECLGYASGNAAFAMACYNGGPSVVQRDFSTWPHETQRYYVWGAGIYQDAVRFSSESATLSEWLNAGGQHLCDRAAQALHYSG